MIRTLTTSALAIALLALAAGAGASQAVSIPFADLGNIQDWKADGHDGIYIKSQTGKWFLATFWAPCDELPFSETVGFVTEPGGSLNRFSSIMAGGQRCWFRSFEPSAPPRGKG